MANLVTVVWSFYFTFIVELFICSGNIFHSYLLHFTHWLALHPFSIMLVTLIKWPANYAKLSYRITPVLTICQLIANS